MARPRAAPPKDAKFPSLEDWLKAGYEEKNYEPEKAKFEAVMEDEATDKALNEGGGSQKLSFPPSPKKDPTTKYLRGKWRDQGRIKCAHPKCCYPLNLKRTSTGDRVPYTIPEEHELEGEKAYEAECSWDPRHKRPEDESKQYVTHLQLFPPEDEGEQDI